MTTAPTASASPKTVNPVGIRSSELLEHQHCPICDREKNPRQKTCSRLCGARLQWSHRKRRTNRGCVVCGEAFIPMKKTALCCSKTCATKLRWRVGALKSTRNAEQKKCPSCGKVKPADAFYRKSTGLLNSYCKLCACALAMASAKKHIGRVRAWAADYKEKHPEKVSRWRRQYSATHQNSVKAAKQRCYAKNRDHYDLRSRENARRDRGLLKVWYVKKLVAAGLGLKAVDVPGGLVRLKTKLIKLKRYAKR